MTHRAQFLSRRSLTVLACLAALVCTRGLEQHALAGSPAYRFELAAEKRHADRERFLQLLREHNHVGTDGDEMWLAVINVDNVFGSLRRSFALRAKRIHDGHTANAARMLDVDRTTLRRWLRLAFPWDDLPAVEVFKQSIVLEIHLDKAHASARAAYGRARIHFVDLALRATGGSGADAAWLLKTSPSFVTHWGNRDGRGITRSPTPGIPDWLTRADVQEQLGLTRLAVARWHPVLKRLGAALDQAGHIVYPPEAVTMVEKLRAEQVSLREALHAAKHAPQDADLLEFVNERQRKQEQQQKHAVLEALRKAGYHHKTAAGLLGVHRKTLERWAKRLRITLRNRRNSRKQHAMP